MDFVEEKRGRFNAGVAFAERLDSLQRAINMARFNLVALNPTTGTYNFEVMKSALDSLFREAEPKCSDAEKTKSIAFRYFSNSLFPILFVISR